MTRFNRRRQQGAALVVVLLLVATLSFIVLAIGERTALAASRALNARLRSELLWRATGAEALAAATIEASAKASDDAMRPDDPLFAAPRPIAMEEGGAVIAFADRTRCFNLNSLVTADEDGGYQENEAMAEELKRVLTAKGGGFTGDKFVSAIVDWIDTDSFQLPDGAEDGFYAGLPAPYRTGSALLADVSEARAMAGVDPELYREALGATCAQPTTEASPINVNMLEAEDAPLLAGLAPELTTAQALDVIADRPPGGYPAITDFWAHDAFAGLEISEEAKNRVKLTSRFVEAYAAIEIGEASADLRLLFEVTEDGRARLISRRLGRYE